MTSPDWETLLARLERELDTDPVHGGDGDDRTIGAGAAWQPPADMPALPAHLAGRARGVLARQRHRAARVQVEMATIRTHLDAVGLIPALRSDDAAYVDRDG